MGTDRRLVVVESVQEVGQVGGCELPLERFRGLVVACFERGESVDDDVKVIEVVVRKYFPLSDGEYDFDLI